MSPPWFAIVAFLNAFVIVSAYAALYLPFDVQYLYERIMLACTAGISIHLLLERYA